MGDEPRAEISAKWEFERFEGLITRNPHRPRYIRLIHLLWVNS